MLDRSIPKLTQQELERHLWGAADILRGTVDAGDYKQYIFGLLFYKRLCDVWDEERPCSPRPGIEKKDWPTGQMLAQGSVPAA
jgi:HsdM N-terminal domain